MSGRQVRTILLCEDRKQATLVRHYLNGIGQSFRIMRTEICPTGSAEQFVRTWYPHEVAALRAKGYQHNLALIVVIDADRESVERRLGQLADALRSEEKSPLAARDRVYILVPKRNVETWIWFLVEDEADEDTDYKHRVSLEMCEPAADRLVGYRNDAWTMPDNCPPSLRRGCDELRRLESS